MTENPTNLWHKIDSKLGKVSNLAFDQRFFPFTMILVLILLSAYMYLFYIWFFPPSIPLSSNPKSGAHVILTQVQEKSDLSGQASIGVSIDTSQILSSDVNGLQVVAEVSGRVPEDITFVPKQIPGLETVIATFDHVDDQLVLKIGFLTPPGGKYIVENSRLDLGSMTFTKPDSGTINFDFSPTLNKILEPKTLNNLLVLPESQSYAF